MATARHKTSGIHYAIAYAVLIGLATLSLFLSSLHLPAGGVALALVIALAKALVVLFVFMHLVEERASSRAVVLVAALLFGLVVLLATTDVATRHTFPPKLSPTRSQEFYQR